eukprot:1249482-Lingulodinium_polyedra.AAC.1
MERQQPLARALVDLSIRRRAFPRLFAGNVKELNQFLQASARDMQLHAIMPIHPYQLRHAGASHDYQSHSRELDAIRKRGRWKA